MRPRLIDTLASWGLSGFGSLIPTPGFVYAVVFLVMTMVFLSRAERVDIPRPRALEVALCAGLGAGLGSRLFFLLTTGDLFRLSVPAWFDGSRGIVSWGGYLGIAAGIGIYCRVTRLAAWPFADLAASVAGLGMAIGRWSCLLAGDDFGRVASLPWAIRYPHGSLPFRAQVAGGLIPADAALSLPVHPFQLYLAASALVDFLVVSVVWRRYSARPGITVAAFLVVHGMTRFPLELFRDPGTGSTGVLSISQWMCLGSIAAGTTIFIARRDRQGAVASSSAAAQA
ncbi:MAG: prolipoprotein diacylglyceryl transferase family protein [Gemmatimonadota bacterium]